MYGKKKNNINISLHAYLVKKSSSRRLVASEGNRWEGKRVMPSFVTQGNWNHGYLALNLPGIENNSPFYSTITSKINVTPKGVYLPISKLHSILAVANLLAHNNKSQICYCGQISLQSAAVNSSFSDILTPSGVTFILLVNPCWDKGLIMFLVDRSQTEAFKYTQGKVRERGEGRK